MPSSVLMSATGKSGTGGGGQKAKWFMGKRGGGQSRAGAGGKIGRLWRSIASWLVVGTAALRLWEAVAQSQRWRFWLLPSSPAKDTMEGTKASAELDLFIIFPSKDSHGGRERERDRVRVREREREGEKEARGTREGESTQKRKLGSGFSSPLWFVLGAG